MAELPDSVREAIEGKNFWHLATISENGAPQSTPVWADTDGTYVIVNTAKGRAKDRHMRSNPRVAMSSFELVLFAALYGFLFLVTGSLFLLGGMFACGALSFKNYRAARTLQLRARQAA